MPILSDARPSNNVTCTGILTVLQTVGQITATEWQPLTASDSEPRESTIQMHPIWAHLVICRCGRCPLWRFVNDLWRASLRRCEG